LWKDEHMPMLSRIAKFIKSQGAVPGIQLAHAGRKASVYSPFAGKKGQVPREAGGTFLTHSHAQPVTARRLLSA
jgi:2,4-dienoyl-CoA reductase-like NADH-dependent reductase (Old Yellow Enzyme family)